MYYSLLNSSSLVDLTVSNVDSGRDNTGQHINMGKLLNTNDIQTQEENLTIQENLPLI